MDYFITEVNMGIKDIIKKFFGMQTYVKENDTIPVTTNKFDMKSDVKEEYSSEHVAKISRKKHDEIVDSLYPKIMAMILKCAEDGIMCMDLNLKDHLENSDQMLWRHIEDLLVKRLAEKGYSTNIYLNCDSSEESLWSDDDDEGEYNKILRIKWN